MRNPCMPTNRLRLHDLVESWKPKTNKTNIINIFAAYAWIIYLYILITEKVTIKHIAKANIEEIARFNFNLDKLLYVHIVIIRKCDVVLRPNDSSSCYLFTLFLCLKILCAFSINFSLLLSTSYYIVNFFNMAPAAQDDVVVEIVSNNNNNNIIDNNSSQRFKVTVIGSGNWGSVAAKLIASNTLILSSFHGTYFSNSFLYHAQLFLLKFYFQCKRII